jgi:hypothetical protein
VANLPPVAVIQAPASFGSNQPVVFRGGGSHDEDAGDSVTAWAWKVSPPPGTTGCEPIPASGSGADLTVVFPCGGDHTVSLTVTDSLGLSSPEETVRAHVEATLDPPRVSAAADVSVDHRCAGTPLVCTPWDGYSSTVALSASGTAPPGATFTFRWSVELPPELASQPPPRITFTPDETAAAPRVLIETAGTAIAGRYTFVVAATDSRGMVAVAQERVTVGNRPPVISAGGVLPLPHAYAPATRSFVATGETPAATWSDPDGDPVTPVGFSSSHAGDGGSLFDVQGQGDRARITVVVPFGQPSDASWLIGPDVHRRVDLVVADANGARASTGWDVVILNRAPRLGTAVPSTSVDHTFDAAARRYVAQAPLSTWVDDDGDPLSLAVAGDPLCPGLEERQGTAWVTCGAAWSGVPAAGTIAGIHSVTVSSRDPFEAGPSQATSLEVRNRAPRLLAVASAIGAACTISSKCCVYDSEIGVCGQRDYTLAPASASVSLVVDDDGDPLDLAAVPSGACLSSSMPAQPCPATGCQVGLSTCGTGWVCGANDPTWTLSLTASDGLGSVSGLVRVGGFCL